MQSKLRYLTDFLEYTQEDMESPVIRINRQKTITSSDLNSGEKICGVSVNGSFFLEMYKQLRNIDTRRFRQEEQAWTVKFYNEGAEDAGGPYRESIAQMCAELQSNLLPFLIPCPNSRDGMGENRDKFIPNSSLTSPEHLQVFNFIGKVLKIINR
jgi:hypothetical protein